MIKTAACILLLLFFYNVAWAAESSSGWNSANIEWKSYEEGLKIASRNHRPICLIFFTSWCPHCRNYSKVFDDPAVVEKSRSFVMIRVDQDQFPELKKQYSPDGKYIPRTFFLSPEGVLDTTITAAASQERYRYFYDEQDPASILAGMDQALVKLRKQ